MKKIIIALSLILLTSCNYRYGNAVNNTTADSLKRIEIYNKNANNLNSINVSDIQKQIIVDDTTILHNQEFTEYCKHNNISANTNDWEQLNIGEYESGHLNVTYTTYNKDTVFTLQTTSNNVDITYKVIKRIIKNI